MQVNILDTDMDIPVKETTIEVIRDGFKRTGSQQDIAKFIKEELDRLCYPAWHCIVGGNFGSCHSSQVCCRMYAKVDENHVLIFKSG